MTPNKNHMQLAISAAKEAKDHSDYPIGAVIIKDNKLVVKAENRSKKDQDPTLHAEIVAIQSAAKLIGRKNLEQCVIYVTHEPCPMCTGAIIYARMKGLVFGARAKDMKEYKLKTKTTKSWRTVDITAKELIEKSPHELLLIEGFMREECQKLFFLL
jgi:tRNA(Arg) A34 adenosine deaminase TadA